MGHHFQDLVCTRFGSSDGSRSRCNLLIGFGIVDCYNGHSNHVAVLVLARVWLDTSSVADSTTNSRGGSSIRNAFSILHSFVLSCSGSRLIIGKRLDVSSNRRPSSKHVVRQIVGPLGRQVLHLDLARSLCGKDILVHFKFAVVHAINGKERHAAQFPELGTIPALSGNFLVLVLAKCIAQLLMGLHDVLAGLVHELLHHGNKFGLHLLLQRITAMKGQFGKHGLGIHLGSFLAGFADDFELFGLAEKVEGVNEVHSDGEKGNLALERTHGLCIVVLRGGSFGQENAIGFEDGEQHERAGHGLLEGASFEKGGFDAGTEGIGDAHANFHFGSVLIGWFSGYLNVSLLFRTDFHFWLN
mmetsp:Transcript_6041/g.12149  ORF Transcript_6041/g.12149 Transcript_6041/m.12149 type:complete len:357 (+) Transcript_6041:820-1890(+)